MKHDQSERDVTKREPSVNKNETRQEQDEVNKRALALSFYRPIQRARARARVCIFYYHMTKVSEVKPNKVNKDIS